jgi:hypothetical protein
LTSRLHVSSTEWYTREAARRKGCANPSACYPPEIPKSPNIHPPLCRRARRHGRNWGTETGELKPREDIRSTLNLCHAIIPTGELKPREGALGWL